MFRKKLIVVHDLDISWRSADLEQRAGKIIRQGNKNKNISVYRYVTKSHGRFYQYDTPKGPRVIVEHTGDTKQGKHFHAGMPKGEFTTTYNFKKYR